ncbi:MAG: 3-deoxy-D-manno-octulosonic acid transferase, partial [Terriglobales bacterium]
MLWLYSMVLAAGMAALSPVLWLRDGRARRYTRHWRERLGRLRRMEVGGAIWVHAVSVGEALAVERLIGELRQRFPQRPVVLSVTTAAARGVVEGRMATEQVFYFPLDFRFSTRRALAAIRPALVLVAETEIWPRFLQQAHRSGARVIFVNGRISGRSYARYRWVRWGLRPALTGVDRWLMQTETDAERIRDLGAPAARVEIAGNLKFDLAPPEHRALLRQLARHFRASGVQSVVVAGSTMESEEAILLRTFGRLRQQFPTALLILAPRHPRRFDAVAELVAASGLPWSRRSQLETAGVPAGGVW